MASESRNLWLSKNQTCALFWYQSGVRFICWCTHPFCAERIWIALVRHVYVSYSFSQDCFSHGRDKWTRDVSGCKGRNWSQYTWVPELESKPSMWVDNSETLKVKVAERKPALAAKFNSTRLWPYPAVLHRQVVKGPCCCLGDDSIICSVDVTVLYNCVVWRIYINAIRAWRVEVAKDRDVAYLHVVGHVDMQAVITTTTNNSGRNCPYAEINRTLDTYLTQFLLRCFLNRVQISQWQLLSAGMLQHKDVKSR